MLTQAQRNETWQKRTLASPTRMPVQMAKVVPRTRFRRGQQARLFADTVIAERADLFITEQLLAWRQHGFRCHACGHQHWGELPPKTHQSWKIGGYLPNPGYRCLEADCACPCRTPPAGATWWTS